ncbi:MAG: sodium/solute symporter [Candidatus Aminicenantes bacterium]|nr:sodium/solute symporter [Candidatus Aminicenantes bacterium]NIM83501.1 sodium/solute symporter [Candidatus Aminicenantes bacterium]NIN22890.1 sodium/solute symporter [Candidatus Aminicenantes bacterium]NIN46629.1 sodium/solute symporter [Candidatus Aminicenantes bacterium]NIN89532.1 sodium/solute symporter [Candidatus Aminicenantes bacterium]
MEIYEKLKDPIAFSIFVFTLFLPVIVGFLTLRRTKNQSDYFVGGRAMNKFVVALSAVSSGRSSWLVLGVSGIAYLRGTGAVWAVMGYITAEMFQFIYIGQKLRKETETFKSLTLLDYFESRFKDKYLLRITGSLIIAIFLTAYVAAQFSGGAKTLSAALGLKPVVSLLIAAMVVLVYMVLGGYIAVAYNDVIRAIIMIIGLVIFPVYGLIKIGGFDVFLETLAQLNPAFVDPFSLSFGLIIGYIGIGLGSPGQPHIVVRYMSIDDPEKLRISTVIGTTWNVIMAWGAVFIGLLGRIAVPVIENLPDKDHELIYVVLSSQYFGPILYGVLVGGIFAAILSTADSQLLVVASTFVRDLYEKIIYEKIRKKKKVLDEAKKLKLSRYVVLASGVLAIVLAYVAQETIFWLVLFAWGGLGASFGTALILSLYWKRVTKYGIFAGMVTGTAVTILWKIFLKETTGLYELIPAFFGSALVIVIVSLLTPKNKN